jgi:tetratricopeptide (TPR) repeat protein
MGVVYAARDPVFDREVAVKVMHPGQDAGRFVVESKVTARLPHPGVPPVYALGELPDGRPFLAMKLVRGHTLADELAADRAVESPRLLGVFEQICLTVGFAHSQGVVLRDLKPANVMVGAFGEVLVMDWGLAQAGDTGQGTGGGDTPGVTGTPAFMAPEQARGERVDARADVFALGGILASILTGRPPFSGDTADETVRKAAAADLREALERLDTCGADAELVALAGRCLAPLAADRPADGRVVAEAVAAYRAGVEERLRRAERDRAVAAAEAREQRKRRRVQFALAAAVVLLVGAGGGFAWWSERRDADQARVEAARVTAEAEARERQQEVERRVAAGRAAAAGLLDQAEAALRAGDAGRAAIPLAEAGRRVGEGGADDLRARLARCRADLDALRRLDAIDRDRWITVGGAFLPWEAIAPRWAAVFASYGITPGVTPPAEAAGRIGDSLVRDRLLTALEGWFLASTRDVGLRAILSAADPDEFRDAARATSYQRALLAWAFRGRPLPGPQPVWFAVAHGFDPDTDLAARERLLLAAHMGRPNDLFLLIGLGAMGGAGDGRALVSAGWWRAALAVEPGSVVAWNNLGVALRDAGDLPGSIAAFREAVRLDAEDPKSHTNLGIALRDAGDRSGSIAACREAIRFDPKYAPAHTNLGIALRDAGDLPGSIAAYREAIRLDPKYAPAHTNLGIALRDAGDRPGAIAAHKEAIRLDPRLAAAHTNLGDALHDAGDLPGSIAACREAIRLDPRYAPAHTNLGIALRDAGDLPAAVAAHKEAIRFDPRSAAAHNNLGVALRDSGDLAGAVAAYREAIRLDPGDPYPRNNLGIALRDVGDRPGAIAAFREAVRLDPKYARAHYNLGIALRAVGDLAGAAAAYQEAILLDPGYAPAHNNLGGVYLDQGKLTEAVACARAAVRADPRYPNGHAVLGLALQRSGDVPGARAALTEAARLDPRFGSLLAGLPPPAVAPPPRPVMPAER